MLSAMKLELMEYLSKQFTEGTVKRYWRSIEQYEAYMGEDKAYYARYREIMEYLCILREKGYKGDYIKTELYGIKMYYKWLLRSGRRTDNPTRNIYLNDQTKKDVQFQNLFTTEELEQLLQREDRYSLMVYRNKLAVSFYIYQGMTTGEISSLTTEDVSIDKESVFIRASAKNNSRLLPLKKNQVQYLDSYLHQERPFLIKAETNNLFISKLGTPEAGEGLHYLIECNKLLFPDRNLNPKTIRQSVIVNLFKKGLDIKDVQLFAGHKYPSSTEIYRPNDLSELQEAIGKFHPLGGI
jgi:integrase/recombinase XerD